MDALNWGARVFFDQFDRVYIVNLESRPDRRREMVKQLRTVGLEGDPRVQFFKAIKTSDAGPFARVGSHGAFLSHLAILKGQAGRNETVLILQDDCDFVPGAQTAEVSEEWDIFYGGYHQLDPGDLHSSGIQGAHCMAFRPGTIPTLVEFLEAVYAGSYRPENEARIDGGSQVAAPIDGAMVWFRRAHPDVRTVFQMVSYQRASRTDIGSLSKIDRFPIVASAFRALSRTFRRLKLALKEQSARS